MHTNDDKYPSRPGFEPGTPRLQAPVDTNEPSGPALLFCIGTTQVVQEDGHLNVKKRQILSPYTDKSMFQS